jgi:hypothetical protein
MNTEPLTNVFKKGYLALGVIAAASLIGYGLSYIIAMPKVSPDGFVPRMLGVSAGTAPGLGAILAVFVLLYALAFLPVNIMFTVKRYGTHPYALVFACCLISLSSVIEILNSLPLIALGSYPGTLERIPADVLLYVRQVETIKWLSYDVAGFSLIYAAILVYAIVYFRSRRLLSYTIIGSIVLFIANLPCLWLAPNIAVLLLALSVLALAPVPIFLARMATE